MGQFHTASPDDQLGMLLESMGAKPNSIRSRSTDMITRTTKYTASDGTEHDSPREAAEHNLTQQIRAIGVEAVGCTYYKQLARNPEALRDALNTYFEDLEAHPDVDDPAGVFFDTDLPSCMWDAGTLKQMIEDGDVSVATDEEAHRGTMCDTPFRPIDALKGGYQAPPGPKGDIESVAIYQDGEWQHFDVSKDGTFTTDLSGTFQLDGDPDDPSTWAVDHPQYCRPFGTRED